MFSVCSKFDPYVTQISLKFQCSNFEICLKLGTICALIWTNKFVFVQTPILLVWYCIFYLLVFACVCLHSDRKFSVFVF